MRRNRLPDDVRARLGRGERVLAHAASPSGPLVATDRALHLPDGHAAPWERVDRARWSEEGLVFTEEGFGERTYAMAEPGSLAEVVFERVTATIVVSRHVPLAEGDDGPRGVRLVARRPPGGADITWHLRFDEGVDPGDPDVRARSAAALADLREQMGI
ncbi:hypothetical protein GCM10022205_48640 [Spinactinospora alkalitolerans]